MKEVKEFLLNNIDKKYLDFSENLNICKGIRALGVRIPVLRSLAKSLSKEYSIDYASNMEKDGVIILMKIIMKRFY